MCTLSNGAPTARNGSSWKKPGGGTGGGGVTLKLCQATWLLFWMKATKFDQLSRSPGLGAGSAADRTRAMKQKGPSPGTWAAGQLMASDTGSMRPTGTVGRLVGPIGFHRFGVTVEAVVNQYWLQL